MPTESPHDDRVYGGPNQWTDYIRYSLADIVVRGEWDDFGIFRLLNRISFMFCKPLVFLIHHEEAEQGKPRFIVDKEVSVFDPVFRAAFDEALRANNALGKDVPDIKGGIRRQLDQAFLAQHAIRMFDTNNSVVAFEIRTDVAARAGAQPKFTFSPIAKRSELGQFISNVFLPFDGIDGRMLLSDRIDAHFAKLRQNGTYVKAGEIHPENEVITYNDISEIGKSSKRGADIIAREYLRLSHSPMLRSFLSESLPVEEAPVNVAFFSKEFSRVTRRYGCYDYDQIFNMGIHQAERILFGLEHASRDDLIAYPAKEHDERFWRSQATREGRIKIIEELRSCLSPYIRLFTENALMSGITMLSPDVFRRGEIGWISGNAREKDRSDALWRLTCLHYVLQLGSPVSPARAHSLSMVSLPFRCSGGIWMCAVFLRDNVSGPNSDLIDQQRFEQSYCIYHSLLRESERRVRRKAKFVYLKELGRLAAREARNMRKRPARDISGAADLSIPHLDETAIKAVNRGAFNLARIYPFPVGRIMSKSCEVEMFENPFFDRLTLRSFINKDDIEREIKTRVLFEANVGVGVGMEWNL